MRLKSLARQRCYSFTSEKKIGDKITRFYDLSHCYLTVEPPFNENLDITNHRLPRSGKSQKKNFQGQGKVRELYFLSEKHLN